MRMCNKLLVRFLVIGKYGAGRGLENRGRI